MTKFIITTSFGLESLVKWQLKDMDYDDFIVEDGKIILNAALKDVCKLNLYLREADRVFLQIKSFKALDFDELFENV